MASAEREQVGAVAVWRVSCARCGRIAGTFDEETVEMILNQHRHRERHLIRRGQLAMEVG